MVRDLDGGGVARAHLASDPGNLPYDGGPVLHSNRTHVIFWEPDGSGLSFEPGYRSLIDTFLSDVAADSHSPDNVYGLTGQYQDALGPAVYNSAYAGSVLDTDPLPPSRCVEPPLTGPGWTVCLTDQQLQDALEQQLKDQIYFWTIHGWINLSLVPATALMEFYKAEIKPDDPNEGWQLTQGYRTKSVDASTGLWRLSRIVKASPALATIFEQVEPQAMMVALDESPEGNVD